MLHSRYFHCHVAMLLCCICGFALSPSGEVTKLHFGRTGIVLYSMFVVRFGSVWQCCMHSDTIKQIIDIFQCIFLSQPFPSISLIYISYILYLISYISYILYLLLSLLSFIAFSISYPIFLIAHSSILSLFHIYLPQPVIPFSPPLFLLSQSLLCILNILSFFRISVSLNYLLFFLQFIFQNDPI